MNQLDSSNQPLLNQNYFEIFRLPVSFRIDLTDLSKRYHLVQMQVHPDKFVGQSDQEQRIALQMASRVNEAYQALLDPEKRAIYLLLLMSEDETLFNKTHVDSSFLFEQIELREEFERMSSGCRDEQGSSELGGFLSKLNDMLQDCLQKIEDFFDAYIPCSETSEPKTGHVDKAIDYSPLANVIQKYQFIAKLSFEVRHLERQARL